MLDIIDKKERVLSPWVTLVEKWTNQNPLPFHSLKQPDYVTLLAVTSDGKIPLVRQYRPALEEYTLELPGGLLEADESPRDRVVQELLEETGFRTVSEPVLLGNLAPDTGRLENRLWCFFADGVELTSNPIDPTE